MKRKMISVILIVTLLMALFAGCGATPSTSTSSTTPAPETKAQQSETSSSGKPLKIGYSLIEMSNPIFADLTRKFQDICKTNGWDLTVVDCQNSPEKQISQVENFIVDKVDVIMLYPAEEKALDGVCEKAQQAGIKVFSMDINLKHSDMAWMVPNYDTGYVIGTQAAKWINEKYNGSCEVAVLDYSKIPVIVERANGIVDAIKKLAPNAKIVAQDSAVTVETGMSVAENMLQANPNIKVFACIGDGGAVGANEAIKAAGLKLDDFGIFAADASEQALAAIANKEALRMSVSLGTPSENSKAMGECVKTLISGKPFEKIVLKKATPVTAENLSEYKSK